MARAPVKGKSEDLVSFNLSIYKNREGRWVAVARVNAPGKQEHVGKPTELGAGEISVLDAIGINSIGVGPTLTIHLGR